MAAVVVGAFFAVAFEAAFAAFHGLFFAAGTWQFPPGSHLITLFPEPFWFELALIAGATIVVSAVAVASSAAATCVPGRPAPRPRTERSATLGQWDVARSSWGELRASGSGSIRRGW